MSEMLERLRILLVLLAISGSAHATFHLWSITQLYSNADGTVQFIELKALAGGQEFLGGHTITSSRGSTTHSFTFPSSLPGDTATTTGGGYYGGGSTTYKSMVIGTQGFASLGAVTPDYIVPNGFLFTSGGILVYGEGADMWTYPSLPTDGSRALNRDGTTSVNSPVNFAGDSGTVTLASTVPGALSGLWWNANESGWGIDFTQRRNVVFAAWFTYDASGNPKWYVASSCSMPSGTTGTTGTCSGALYEVNGPTFFGTAFNPSLANVVTAGTIQVSFENAGAATMTYTVAGQTRTVAITRQPVGTGTTQPSVDYTDLWWNPDESGWGMAIAQQFSNIFLAWYLYDSAGKPTWYVASNCVVSGSGCSGTLYRTMGPAFGPTFSPSQVQVFAAGTVSINFTDANNGTLSYTVNGATASKTITRQLF
jgi:hypothetical protein